MSDVDSVSSDEILSSDDQSVPENNPRIFVENGDPVRFFIHNSLSKQQKLILTRKIMASP